VKRRNPGGRPRLSLREKVRRGTVEPGRERKAPVTRRRTAPIARGRNSPELRDYLAILEDYIVGIQSNSLVACRWTKLAVERFVRMRTDSQVSFAPQVTSDTKVGITNHYTWSPQHVVDVCAFIERLPHVEGRWPTPTIQLEPFQIFILSAVYGFRRRHDGGRLVTSVFFEVARKSAKSTLVAACALYHLVAEKEPGAQVICGATTGSQARICFSIMQRMVKRAAWLRELGLTVYANAITSLDGNAKPINAKSSTQDGLNPSFISLDESHAQNFELHDVLKSAQGSRREPMLMAPTTAGFSLTSVGYALRQAAMKVLEGVTQADHFFCVLYELDQGDDWRDEAAWIKAAPMLGVTPTREYLRTYRDDAIATPGLQGEFEVKVCNRWLHSASTWLSMDAWNQCADRSISLEDFHHEPCWIGVDLAERDDITAVALLFKRNDLVYVFVRGYLPALVVNERARAVPEYRLWLQKGELVATEGNLTDYPTIEADLRSDCETFDVQELVIEKYGALNLAANLASTNIPVRLEAKHPKTFTPPAKELEARIKARQLRHTGSSFLTWQISNVCVDRKRDGSLLPTKEAPMSANKIDAVDALLLALSGMLAATTVPEVEPRIWFLEA
jgi:phage terminase large subunit-like protein